MSGIDFIKNASTIVYFEMTESMASAMRAIDQMKNQLTPSQLVNLHRATARYAWTYMIDLALEAQALAGSGSRTWSAGRWRGWLNQLSPTHPLARKMARYPMLHPVIHGPVSSKGIADIFESFFERDSWKIRELCLAGERAGRQLRPPEGRVFRHLVCILGEN